MDPAAPPRPQRLDPLLAVLSLAPVPQLRPLGDAVQTPSDCVARAPGSAAACLLALLAARRLGISAARQPYSSVGAYSRVA